MFNHLRKSRVKHDQGAVMHSELRATKILIIADEQMNRFMLKRELQTAHYDVITAENEEEGLQLATTIQPDVILIDWAISPLGSLTMFEQLRNDPISSSIPVIFVTDKVNGAIMEGGLGLGSVDYVLRPYKLKELQDCIRRVLVARDERQRLREEIQRIRSNLAAIMANGLRYPITIIAGFAELINEQNSCSASSAPVDYLQQIIRQAENLKDLSEDLNYILQYEEFVEDVDLARVVEAAVERFRKQIEEKKQRITLNFQERDRLVVKGKSHHLFMALRHLISNAHKFTHSGGTITVTITPMNDRVRIDVADTGIGIPKAQQRLILEDLYHGEKELTWRWRGMGLGLKIARSVAEQHQGSFSFESMSGRGSHFWIDLPLSRQDKCLTSLAPHYQV